jgi:hypothetical protein
MLWQNASLTHVGLNTFLDSNLIWTLQPNEDRNFMSCDIMKKLKRNGLPMAFLAFFLVPLKDKMKGSRTNLGSHEDL